ncbi:hypothetical protein P7K49_028219 [Saguinus oedipus]|uniref:Uncharacterized protein n=1 Tax=Saguinus oedipus TaxID=9490 RepID=A0ABQ9UBP5_SAGOE|nr:hypothetical protein P7K49_028219 [Saguinus oedipus]
MSLEQFQHLKDQQEIVIQQLNIPENDGLPSGHQEPTTQPTTQLSSEFVSSLNNEMVFSPLDLISIFRTVTVEAEPSPVQQDNPPLPTEQADFSLAQPDPPSSPLDSSERSESVAQQEAQGPTPEPPRLQEVEPSPVGLNL